MVDKEYDKAIRNLYIAKEYALKRDSFSLDGKCIY